MLTQLLFEHALRIRVKAETSSSSSEGSVKDASVASSSSNSGSSTPVASTPALPAQEWTESGHEERDVSVTSTLIASNEDGSPTPSTRDSVGAKTLVGSIKSKLRSRFSKDKNGKKSEPSKTAAKGPEAADSSESGDGNLVGKLNNLVSTDLSNITDARDFIFLLIYVPIQVVLGITFLYVILGWRYVSFRRRISKVYLTDEDAVHSSDSLSCFFSSRPRDMSPKSCRNINSRE